MADTTKTLRTLSCHVLTFFCDDEDASALTVLIRGVRFHIIVDATRLKDNGHEALLTDYLSLLQDFRNSEIEGDCPSTTVGQATTAANIEEKVDPFGKSDSKTSDAEDDKDSAIDLSADRKTRSQSNTLETSVDTDDAESRLQNWILSFFNEETNHLAPADSKVEEPSLKQWYCATTYFFDLEADKDCLKPRRLEDTSELKDRIQELIPRLAMPKYIQNMGLPWVNAKDITVLSEVSEPTPVHPGLVRAGDELQFFKPADPDQPQAIKREIKILHNIAKLGLHHKIRVPRLLGLVAYEDNSTEIMGILLSNISDPKPLTTLLSSDVPENQRLRWADDSKDMVKILHENGFVWGDAKADNFLVDENNDLWIIDFGGSYTEGWVNPELAETKDGDKMGIEKIVDALVDLDENTFDPEDEEEGDSDYVPQARKRKHDAAEPSEHLGGKKARKG